MNKTILDMEISYLCAARVSDVLKLSKKQISERGVFIQQGKTGVKQIKQWNDRLRQAVELAFSEFGKGNTTLLVNTKGSTVIHKTFNTHFLNARNAASKKLGYPLTCTFHDIKAKGISDFEGSSKDKQLFSGNKTENQALVYDSKTKITPSLDIPSIKKI